MIKSADEKHSEQVNKVLDELMREFGDIETSAVVLCEVLRKINFTTNRRTWSTLLDDDLNDKIIHYEERLWCAGGRKLDIVLLRMDEMLARTNDLWLKPDSFARKIVSNSREGISHYFQS